MRGLVTHRYILCASVVALLSPAALAGASENSLTEALARTNSSLLHVRQTALGQVEAGPSEEFSLGVRNRSLHEGASASTEVGAPVSARQPRTALGSSDRPDYTFRDWWRGASQTKKTGVIVGAAVVFLVIAL